MFAGCVNVIGQVSAEPPLFEKPLDGTVTVKSTVLDVS